MIKVPKDAGWLIPGLEVKRWFSLIIIGVTLALLGLCIILNLKPIYWLIGILLKDAVETIFRGTFFIGFFFGFAKTD